MKYLIETYGCQLNKAESDALEILLKGRGIEKTENPDEADAVILNTCSVRKTAENRIWGRLGFYSAEKRKHGTRIIVTGCMAERLKEDLKKDAPYVDAVIGTNDKASIPDFIVSGSIPSLDHYSFQRSYYQEGAYSSYVPIMNGCNNFCSYCIVPYVRGREVSRPVEDIIEEIKALEERNVREITLLGQNVNSYSSEYNGSHVDFPTLLEIIVPYMESIEFVRFESPHPKDFSDHLIDVIARERRIASHIHLPMQSGSTRILSLTDVMVGFPSETEEEYEETLSMMEIMGCTEAFMYYFNPREGTRAASMDGQIEDEIKIRRLERLINEQLERQKRIQESMIPFSAAVLVTGRSRDDEGMYLGRSEHNDYFVFSSSSPLSDGDIVKVNADELSGNTFRGHKVE